MTSGQPKRKRGVVLTPTGRQKFQEAIAVWEKDNFGEKLTIEELSDRTKLDAGTVAKVLDCEAIHSAEVCRRITVRGLWDLGVRD